MSLDFLSNSKRDWTPMSCEWQDGGWNGLMNDLHQCISLSRITDHYGDLMPTNMMETSKQMTKSLWSLGTYSEANVLCIVLCVLRAVARICILWIGAVSWMLYKHCLRISIFTADKLYMYSIVNLSYEQLHLYFTVFGNTHVRLQSNSKAIRLVKIEFNRFEMIIVNMYYVLLKCRLNFWSYT